MKIMMQVPNLFSRMTGRGKPFRFTFPIFTLALLLSVSFQPSPAETTATRAYWVFFKDKPASNAQPVAIDSHARERRRLRGIRGVSGDFDLPVSPAYIEAVLSLPGVSLRGESRWFNAVSVDAREDALEKLKGLPFVKGIQPVAIADRSSFEDDIGMVGEYARREVNERLAEDFEPPQWNPTLPDPAAYDYKLNRAWYGPSWNQVVMVNAMEAHMRGNHGQGVRIAVLDGGFQLDHEAFAGLNVIAQYDFINNDDDTSYDPAQDIYSQPHHGTACMSVIGGYSPGNLIGLAHEAEFILCKTEYVPTETVAEEDYWVRALEWSESLGADVLSSSLSYKDWYVLSDYDGITPITSRAAQIAFELGMVLCTSAGNEGPEPMTLGAPTDAEGVLSIGALRPNGDLASFSSRGPTADGRIKPDICAQGVRTACVMPHTWNEYAFWSGTSLSCPVAAGCMALLVAEHPDWTPAQIYEAARQTASRAERPDNNYGWGCLNLEEAIHYPSVSGWVLDEEGRGIPNVKLQLFGEIQGLITHTTEDGFYRFSNLKEDEVRLQVIFSDGSRSDFVTLTVPPSREMDFMKGR